MTYYDIVILRNKIEIHKETLYAMDNLELDLINSVLKTLITMKANELIIESWFRNIQKEIQTIELIIEQLEKEEIDDT